MRTPDRRPSPRPLARSLLLFPLALLAACDDHGSSEVIVVTETLPAYPESEPNDDEASANDFGTLYPGDLFLIQGHSTDDGSDPFDGFSFVAGSPLHVDFRLFDEPYSGDLDVWLYDPLIGEVVGYFETENHPEVGGVDVVAAGLEFHLIVTAWSGHSDYDLEIAVTPLAPAAAARAPGAASVLAHAEPTPLLDRARRLAPTDYGARASERPLARIEMGSEPGLSWVVVERYTEPERP